MASMNHVTDGDPILVHHRQGELGDKLVGCYIVTALHDLYPHSPIDVATWAIGERGNAPYCEIYRLLPFVRKAFHSADPPYGEYGSVFTLDSADCDQAETGKELFWPSREEVWAKKHKIALPHEIKIPFEFPEETTRVARGMLANLPHPLIGFAPLTTNACKDWPRDRTQAVIDRLARLGSVILIHDRQLPYVNCWQLPRLSLPELGAMIRECAVVVSTDNGVMHWAGVLGVPLVCLFGPTNTAIGLRYRRKMLRQTWDCSPCSRHISLDHDYHRKAGCLQGDPSRCMGGISVRDIWVTASRMVEA